MKPDFLISRVGHCKAKYLAQLIISGARVLGRAFTQALKEEYTASQQAAQARRNQGGSDSGQRTFDQFAGLSLDEAKQILNVKDIHDTETLRKHYEHLFSVFRAKERIDEELQYEQGKRDPDEKSQSSSSPP
ncbi:unnamed protein product [Echinostoma caproni]|uniref:Mitochondrial import inner membrane translocase subunit TIM16 n=1 Tax=Echinostoma caproni TaxID=27848 RepID=A0A183B4M6_9TREM|nr:unnamed protein product [Echinostoma caproni]